MFNESACQFSGQTCSPEVRMSRNSFQCYALPVKEKIASYTKNTLVVIQACRLLQAKFHTSELICIVLLFFFKLFYAPSLLFDLSKCTKR